MLSVIYTVFIAFPQVAIFAKHLEVRELKLKLRVSGARFDMIYMENNAIFRMGNSPTDQTLPAIDFKGLIAQRSPGVGGIKSLVSGILGLGFSSGSGGDFSCKLKQDAVGGLFSNGGYGLLLVP